MKSFWKQLRNESEPSNHFKNELKARIYENATQKERSFFLGYIKNIIIPKPNLVLKIEKHYSVVQRFKDFFTSLQEKTIRLSYVIAGGLAAMILIIPMLSLFTITPSSASEPSFIRNIEGTVAIKRMNESISPSQNFEIFNSDTISTGNKSQAEIIFFEGTVLRMSENTEIEVSKINPHPLLLSTGGIEVKVKHGLIWVKTFQLSAEDKGIIINTPNTKIIPERAVFSTSYIDGKDSLLVFENSVDIALSGIHISENKEVFSGEYIIFSPFDEFLPLNEIITTETKNSEWIQQNKLKDISYTSEYLERIGKAMQEKYIVNSLGTQIETFLESNPNPEEVEKLISDINELLLLADQPAHTPHENIESDEDTDTPSPTPKNTVIPYLYSNNTSYTSQNRETIAPTTPLPIDNLTTELDNIEEISEPEKEEKKSATQLAQEYQEQQRTERIEAISESFVNQVEAFEFESSRSTQAQNLIDKIPSTPENLDLLKELEEKSPRDVKKIVKQKRIELEKQILLEEEENLKNSALPEGLELEEVTPSQTPVPSSSSLEEEDTL